MKKAIGHIVTIASGVALGYFIANKLDVTGKASSESGEEKPNYKTAPFGYGRKYTQI